MTITFCRYAGRGESIRLDFAITTRMSNHLGVSHLRACPSVAIAMSY